MDLTSPGGAPEVQKSIFDNAVAEAVEVEG